MRGCEEGEGSMGLRGWSLTGAAEVLPVSGGEHGVEAEPRA